MRPLLSSKLHWMPPFTPTLTVCPAAGPGSRHTNTSIITVRTTVGSVIVQRPSRCPLNTADRCRCHLGYRGLATTFDAGAGGVIGGFVGPETDRAIGPELDASP